MFGSVVPAVDDHVPPHAWTRGIVVSDRLEMFDQQIGRKSVIRSAVTLEQPHDLADRYVGRQPSTIVTIREGMVSMHIVDPVTGVRQRVGEPSLIFRA